MRSFRARTILYFLILFLPATSFGHDSDDFLPAASSGYDADDDAVSWIRSRALPLSTGNDLESMIEIAGERKLVLTGEASHGTREYYAWRDTISRRLIEDHGFNFIAVEGDWASLYELNRYVKGMSGAASGAAAVLENLDRWPLWMWGNEEIVALAEWLRSYNEGLPEDKRVGFYGMDVYDEFRSKDEVLAFFETHNTGLYDQARQYYDCFSPYGRDSWEYAQSVARGIGEECSDPAAAVFALFEEHRGDLKEVAGDEYYFAKQNARVVKNAEKFYRKSVTRQDASAWNSRAGHMNTTVNHLLDLYGEDARGIVWAHNTHIGDARFTEMQQFRQENIGQMARLEHGPENVFLIGFSTYQGEVKAGAQWEGAMQKMEVPPARQGSIEAVFESTGMDAFHLLLDDDDRTHDGFMEPMGNRAIGVVYDPRNDHQQNYVNTVVPMRYDAILFFRETEALTPLIR